VVANGFLHPGSGMAQGFEEFAMPAGGAMMASFLRDLPLTRLIVALTPPAKWGDYRAQGLTDIALRWLGEADPRPLFLWVHYMDPHSPYQADAARLDVSALGDMIHQDQPPVRADGTVVGDIFAATDLVRSGAIWLGPRDRERLKEYYAGEVAYTDRHVGRLFEALRARSAKRKVVAALTADHGEEFWDHGHFEHGHDYYREVTWVPLVFWGSAAVPPGRTVDTVAGLVDIAPTLVELAGLPAMPPEAPDEGRSLTGLWGGGEAAAASSAPHVRGWQPLRPAHRDGRARTVEVPAARQRHAGAVRRVGRSAGTPQPGLRPLRHRGTVPPRARAAARRAHAHRHGRHRAEAHARAARGVEGAGVCEVARRRRTSDHDTTGLRGSGRIDERSGGERSRRR
jgi:hypothetical protein